MEAPKRNENRDISPDGRREREREEEMVCLIHNAVEIVAF